MVCLFARQQTGDALVAEARLCDLGRMKNHQFTLRAAVAGALLLGSALPVGEQAQLRAEPPASSTANLDAALRMQRSPEYALVATGQWRALEDQLPRLKRSGEALVDSEIACYS